MALERGLRSRRRAKSGPFRRDASCSAVFAKLKRLSGCLLVPPSSAFDLGCYRKSGEARVGCRLHQMGVQLRSWRGIADLHHDAVLWTEQVLPSDFWTVVASTDAEMLRLRRMERSARLRSGLLVQWHQPDLECLSGAAQRAR